MNTSQEYFSKSAKQVPAGSSRQEGCFRCRHCLNIVEPTAAQIELAENACSPDPALKCPLCHKYTVHWQQPVAIKTSLPAGAVSQEHGRELFAGIFRMLAEL
jgi:hypothetical protein